MATAAPSESAGEGEPIPVKKRFRIGLIIGGASMFAAGYVISVAMAIAAGTQVANTEDGACWAYMASYGALPFFGAGIGVAAQLGKQAGLKSSAPECHNRSAFIPVAVIGILSTAMQVLGVVGIAVGFKRVPVDPVAGIGAPEGPQLSVTAGAPGSLLGLSLKLTHW